MNNKFDEFYQEPGPIGHAPGSAEEIRSRRRHGAGVLRVGEQGTRRLGAMPK